MGPSITQQMRDYVTVALEEQLLLRKAGYDPVVLPDDLIGLMYGASELDPKITIATVVNEVAYLFKEYCGRSTVREYLVLRQYFSPEDNLRVRTMLLLGLHHPERNREPMDIGDPESIQRNIALLKAVMIFRQCSDEKLINKVLAYNDKGAQEQGFCDNECADLIIDHSEHTELLMSTMLERGYEEGIEVFKNMMVANTPALMHGAL